MLNRIILRWKLYAGQSLTTLSKTLMSGRKIVMGDRSATFGDGTLLGM
jgi:hypothetical protein